MRGSTETLGGGGGATWVRGYRGQVKIHGVPRPGFGDFGPLKGQPHPIFSTEKVLAPLLNPRREGPMISGLLVSEAISQKRLRRFL